MTGRRWLVTLGIAVLAIAAVAVLKNWQWPWTKPSRFELAECPEHWKRLPKRLGGGLLGPEGFALSKRNTDVPEFNDCQKLIVNQGTKYGPLTAIFASASLDSVDFVLDTQVVDSVSAAALILNLDRSEYTPLGIKPGFSCLYVWSDPGPVPPGPVDSLRWHAMLLWVDTAQSRCTVPRHPHELQSSDLKVKRTFSGDAHENFPPVARWDFDSVRMENYMGIKCGAGWCEIGRPGFTAMPPYHDVLSAQPREQRIKGWYDEQLLAHVDDDGKFGLSAVKGTVFPAPGSVEMEALKAAVTAVNTLERWKQVAYIALDRPSPYYKRMMNLDAVQASASFPEMNILSFCEGTREQCGTPNAPSAAQVAQMTQAGIPRLAPKSGCDEGAITAIWVRITPAGRPPGSPEDMYRCVTRRTHNIDVEIPATARWRWLLSDETVWRECTKGCCQVEADG